VHKTFSPLFNPATPEEVKTGARDKLLKRYEWIDGELAGKEYLLGTHFSVADAYLFVVTRWAKPMGVDLSRFANISAHHQRIAERAPVQEALAFEGLAGK